METKKMERTEICTFLKNVFKDIVGNGNDHNTLTDRTLLIIAVHAVLLEFGFVCVDRLSQRKIDRFRSRSGHVRYTVPDLIGVDGQVLETVEFRVQTWGNKFVNVIGSVSKNPAFRLCLDKFCFLPSLEFVCKSMTNASSKSFRESKVVEFWRIVKDELALPLLTDLCEKTGLKPPPCFMRLPAELKLKILEFLPANDLAIVGCVSSELSSLSSDNDLWKQRYEEEAPLVGTRMEFLVLDSILRVLACCKTKFLACRDRVNRRRRGIGFLNRV